MKSVAAGIVSTTQAISNQANHAAQIAPAAIATP
jgi:hypothetical protein